MDLSKYGCWKRAGNCSPSPQLKRIPTIYDDVRACSPARGTGYKATCFFLSKLSDLSHLLSSSRRDSFDGGPIQHLHRVFIS